MYFNGRVRTVTTTPDLRSGVLTDVSGNTLQTYDDYYNHIKNYLDLYRSHGVRAFVFAYTVGGRKLGATVKYIRVTATEILKNPTYFYTYNTDGDFLALTYRPDRRAIDFFENNCTQITAIEYDALLDAMNTINKNSGYGAETVLYGRPQTKKTYSDGKSISPTGKKENSQLKASVYNSSGSRSKTCNIWSARYDKK